MKTAVSLPDGLFEVAERLARRLRKSRSKLYSDALAEYVARHDPDLVTETLNDVLSKAKVAPDDFVGAAARRALERSSW